MPILPVAFTGFLALFGIVGRNYVVPEAHVVPVRSAEGHRRLIWPGPNNLGAGEQPGEPIDTRPQEVVLDVPNVVLHNGLPGTVNLRYTLRLLPKEMNPTALYWGAAQRKTVQVQILRDSLQHAIAELPRPIVLEDPDCISLGMILSPFVGASFDALSRKTQERGRKHLAEQAMHMLVNTLMIESVSLSPALVEAYHDFRRANFDSAAGYVFMRRVQVIVPTMADSCVIRLQSAICKDAPGMRDILHEGKFSPPAFAGVANVMVKVTTGQDPNHPSVPYEPQVATVTVGHQPAATTEQEYPLTPEVMASLKAL